MQRKDYRLYKNIICRACDSAWLHILEPQAQKEYCGDLYRLRQNSDICATCATVARLKLYLLSVRITTWKQLIMCLKAWEMEETVKEGWDGNYEYVWQVMNRIIEPLQSLRDKGLIHHLDQEINIRLLDKVILKTGTSAFQESRGTDIWEAVENITKEVLWDWMETRDWEDFMQIRQEKHPVRITEKIYELEKKWYDE